MFIEQREIFPLDSEEKSEYSNLNSSQINSKIILSISIFQ